MPCEWVVYCPWGQGGFSLLSYCFCTWGVSMDSVLLCVRKGVPDFYSWMCYSERLALYWCAACILYISLLLSDQKANQRCFLTFVMHDASAVAWTSDCCWKYAVFSYMHELACPSACTEISVTDVQAQDAGAASLHIPLPNCGPYSCTSRCFVRVLSCNGFLS